MQFLKVYFSSVSCEYYAKTIVFIFSIFLYYINNYVAGFALILLGLIGYILNYKKSKNLLTIKGCFDLFYTSSIGLATLKLVGIYDVNWKVRTWLLLLAFYILFPISYELSSGFGERIINRIKKYKKNIISIRTINNNELGKYAAYVLTVLSILSFLYIYSKSGFIPLFSQDLHSYTEFGKEIDLVLFCQLSIILPSVLIYYFFDKNTAKLSRIVVLIFAFLNIIVCTLFKSRDMLLGQCITLLSSVYLCLRERTNFGGKKLNTVLVIIIIVSLFLFFILSIARNYNNEYIRNLYLAHDTPLPDFLISPYVYITSGYYNFDLLASNLSNYFFGLMFLKPVLILFRLRFLRSIVDSAPVFQISSTLNVSSSLADPYYDFGGFGVIAFAIFFGLMACLIEKLQKKGFCAMSASLYGIIIHHIILIFFVNWFTNFQYFIITILLVFLFFVDKEGTHDGR